MRTSPRTPAPGSDPAVVARPDDARRVPGGFGARTVVVTYLGGFLMGSADLVPGVSGGTIALVLGIYQRLVANVRQGARAGSLLVRLAGADALRALRHVEWSFLLPLLAGIGTAVLTLAAGLEHLLQTQPVMLAAVFAGLVAGSVVVSLGEVHEHRASTWLVVAASAVVTFGALGLRTGRLTDPSLLMVFLGGALAVCAMILPGISGSFILLMIGLYGFVLGAVNDRDLLTVAVFVLGTALGLGTFSTLLNWLLRRWHDLILAALIGLMLGSLRVLWPWPAGEHGVGDTALGAPVPGEVLPAAALAVAGVASVVLVAWVARTVSEADD